MNNRKAAGSINPDAAFMLKVGYLREPIGGEFVDVGLDKARSTYAHGGRVFVRLGNKAGEVWRNDALYNNAAKVQFCVMPNAEPVSHYVWLEEHLPAFLAKVGLKDVAVRPLLSAHGDKFYGYKRAFENAGMAFHEGVAIGLLTYFAPFDAEARQTPSGWVRVEDWVVKNKERFLPLLRGE